MATEQESLQPFRCIVCSKRFTRMENLKRHSTLHDKNTERSAFRCSLCDATFSRADLKRRHVASKHGDEIQGKGMREEARRSMSTSSSAQQVEAMEGVIGSGSSLTKSAAVDTPPPPDPHPLAVDSMNFDFNNDFPTASSWSSSHLGASSSTSNTQPSTSSYQPPPPLSAPPPTAPPLNHSSVGSSAPDTNNRASQSPLSSLTLSSETDLIQSPAFIYAAVESFFLYTSHIFPFIHRPTFDSRACHPSLLLGMMCIGLHVSSDGRQDRQRANNCYQAGLRSLDGIMETVQAKSAETLAIIQAHLLLENYAIMALCGPHTSYGLRLHHQCIEIARKGGLMDSYPTQPSSTQDLNSLWQQFVQAESHKRTAYSLFVFDSTWYHFMSRPRCLSHLEIKHELPCSDDTWSATSSAEWAHRALLVNPGAAPRMRFLEAVRSMFAQANDPLRLDAMGASIMTHFILAGVREMTGWTTMTGRSCFERFEALHGSMAKLEGLVVTTDLAGETPASAVAEATWRMSMMELLLWSQTHTGGLVEDSIDAAMAAITLLGANHRIDLTAQIIKSVEEHVTWFLLYLQRTLDTRFEPPFLTFYAFKAAVTAWQIVKSGGSTPLAVVGVADADGLLQWMREMFGKRTRWGIGKFALESLGELQEHSLS
ncbi:hypothetical protein IAT38_003210 [Cryptococcus sp. DSM 104549]